MASYTSPYETESNIPDDAKVPTPQMKPGPVLDSSGKPYTDPYTTDVVPEEDKVESSQFKNKEAAVDNSGKSYISPYTTVSDTPSRKPSLFTKLKNKLPGNH